MIGRPTIPATTFPLGLVQLLLLLLALSSSTGADEAAAGAATTVLDLSVEPPEIRLEIETGVPDLVVFEPLFADDFRVRMGLPPEPADARRRRFCSEDLVLRADGGEPLIGEVVAFEVHRRSSAVLPPERRLTAAGRAGRPVVRVVLRYPFGERRPEHLSLRSPPPDRRSAGSRLALAIWHCGAPVSDLVEFDGEAVIELHWDDPWRSRLHGAEPPRLGSPLAVVLAVGPARTRVQVVARVRDLVPATDLGGGHVDVDPVELRHRIVARVAERVVGGVGLSIDGRPAEPALVRADLVDRRLRGWQPLEATGPIEGATATAVVELAADTAQPPGRVDLEWTLFPDSVDRVRAVVIDPGGSRRAELTRADTRLSWTAPPAVFASNELLEVPAPPSAASRAALWSCWIAGVLVGGCAIRATARAAGGAAPWRSVAWLVLLLAVVACGGWLATDRTVVGEGRAGRIVTALLHNAYLEHDDLDEAAILAGLADAPEPRPGGAAPAAGTEERIGRRRFEMLELRVVRTGPAIVARAAWRLTTPVVRLGDLDRRISRVVADLRVEPVAGEWRIGSLRTVDTDRR